MSDHWLELTVPHFGVKVRSKRKRKEERESVSPLFGSCQQHSLRARLGTYCRTGLYFRRHSTPTRLLPYLLRYSYRSLSLRLCEKRGSTAGSVHRQFCGRLFDQPDQPGDQTRLDSTEHLRRHSCRHACCDVPTGPLQITVPVSFQEEIIEVVKPIPTERISERTFEQLVDMPDPQIQEQIVEAAERIPQERISEHTVEQIAGVSVPQIHEQIMEVANTIPQERISERIVEHARDVPVPQLREKNCGSRQKHSP